MGNLFNKSTEATPVPDKSNKVVSYSAGSVSTSTISSVSTSTISSVSTSTISSVSKSTISSVSKSTISSVTQPAANSVVKSSYSPVVKPTYGPVVNSADSPVVKPAYGPVVNSADSLSVKYGHSSVVKSANSSVVKSVNSAGTSQTRLDASLADETEEKTFYSPPPVKEVKKIDVKLNNRFTVPKKLFGNKKAFEDVNLSDENLIEAVKTLVKRKESKMKNHNKIQFKYNTDIKYFLEHYNKIPQE